MLIIDGILFTRSMVDHITITAILFITVYELNYLLLCGLWNGIFWLLFKYSQSFKNKHILSVAQENVINQLKNEIGSDDYVNILVKLEIERLKKI
jgi:hypothetical protein